MAREKLTKGPNGHLDIAKVGARTKAWSQRHFELAVPVLSGLVARAESVDHDRAAGLRSLLQVTASVGAKVAAESDARHF